MASPIVIFEDTGFANLYPLTLTRPVFDLRCGILTLAEKAAVVAGGLHGESQGGGPARESLHYHAREYLAPFIAGSITSYSELAGDAGSVLLLNGRLLPAPDLLEVISRGGRGVYVAGGTVAAAKVGREDARRLDGALGSPLDRAVFSGLPEQEIEATLVEYPWDLVRMNGAEITADCRLLGVGGIAADLPEGVWLVDKTSICIDENVTIAPGVVLDAGDGPIYIADGASVMAGSTLRGPLYVGAGTVIKMGARIYGETSIGPGCKIGGEVAETIVHGFSNKQHEGFVGHSYLGEWVNLGAGTDTSDLKNNYSNVKIRVHDRYVDSGEMFIGLFMGDHSKSGIGTTFNTGTVVGAFCNIFGSDYPPKFIPSFMWGGSAGFDEYDPARALETAARVMRRRGVRPGPGLEAVLKRVHQISSDSRKAFLKGA